MFDYEVSKSIICEYDDRNKIKAPIGFSIGKSEEEIIGLDCSFIPYIYCNQPLAQQSTGIFNNNSNYNCSSNSYNGAEKIYLLDLTKTSNVEIKISNFGNRQLDAFLLSSCNSNSCLAGGEDIISLNNLDSGEYYVAIDGISFSDNGAFDIQVSCNNLDCNQATEVLDCNDYILSGDTTNMPSIQNLYGCNLKNYPGNEQIYHFKLDSPTHIYAKINEPGIEAILLNECKAEACENAGSEFTKYNAPAGDYYLVIDSTLEGGIPYSGILDCGVRMNCSQTQSITCGQIITTTTSYGTNSNELYKCSGNRLENGKEKVFVFQNNQLRNIAVNLSNLSNDLDVFILKGCDEGECVSYGDLTAKGAMLQPGTYYIVVDGVNGAEGNFTITLACQPPAYLPPYTQCFENGDDFTTSGFWHLIENPPNIFVPPPVNTFSYYPDFPDLYYACEGNRAYWYGENSTGTFIGPYDPNQGPGTGGTSLYPNTGDLITPPIDLTGATNAQLKFDCWWEIEGVDVDRYDMMYIDISLNNGPFFQIGTLNPINDVNGAPPYPYSSDGFNLPITHCLNPLFNLTPYVGNRVRIRFRFDTRDELYNAFRGWLVDCVRITGEAIPDPIITGVDPVCNVGPTTLLHIYGENFVNGATVSFDGIPASVWAVISSNEIQANIPSNLNCPGPISVTVDNPGDGGIATLEDAFMCGTESCLPFADAGPDKLICQGQSVQIGGNPTAKGGQPPYTYSWLPTAGLDNPSASNPKATPTSTTTYTVTVTDSASQTDTDSTIITVRNAPISSFSSNSPQCFGQAICFSDQSIEVPTSWFWDFGDGIGTSAEQNPCYSYSSPGNYNVSLIASNECGIGSPYNSAVSVINKPTADFISNSPQCMQQSGGTICFSDTSTNNPTAWFWNFGDGSGSSTEQNPCYTYANAGNYSVSLIASNTCGSSQPTSKTVQLKDSPTANFTSDQPKCLNVPVNFTDTSTNNPTSWLWNFGDGIGTSTTQNPSYAYSSAGTYIVSLIASNECGPSSAFSSVINIKDVPQADFTSTSPQCLGNAISFTDNSSGNPTSWHWDFGDGIGTSTEQNPTYTYQNPGFYQVSLTTFNDCGASETITKNIVITQEPIANFSSKNEECLGVPIYFFDTSAGNPTSWAWNFGDGIGTSTEQNPVYTYSAIGDYTVSLISSNACGSSSPYSKIISIGSTPAASFSHDAPKCAGLPINFTDQSSGNPTSWNWDFGDGAGSSNEQSPSYIYTNAGTYIARLIVFNSCGASAPYTATIKIDGEPISDFSYSTPLCQGTEIQFTDLSSGFPNSWLWDFGDNTTSTEQNPTHIYAYSGTFNVSLTTTNTCGTSQPTIKILSVNPQPIANFIYSSPTCAGSSILFTDTSTGNPISWEWDFENDGTIDSTLQNPTHVYESPGTYYVALRITNQCGSNTIIKEINVNPALPVANFSFNQPVCDGSPVNFTDLSSNNPNYWEWDFDNNNTIDSTLQNPSYIYPYDNIWTAKLVSYNACGASDPHYDEVAVLPCNFDCSDNIIPIQCGDTISGSTVGGFNQINSYICKPGAIYSGTESEAHHRFPYGQLKNDDNIILTLVSDNPDLDIFVLANCEPPTSQNEPVNCVAWGDDKAVFAGDINKRFYVIIDGKNGASGNYTLHADCFKDQACIPPVFSGLDSATDLDQCQPTGIKLQWTPVTDWGTGTSGTYAIKRDGKVIASAIPGTDAEYIDIYAIPGVPHTYQINAMNDACGETDGNNNILTATDNYASKPQFDGIQSAVDSDACGYSGILISWNPGSSNIIGYNVYRATLSDCSDAVNIATVSTTSYLDTAADPGSIYYYYVEAFTACGQSSRGNNACLQVVDGTQEPPTFDGLQKAFDIDPCQDSGVKLQWNPVIDWGSGTSGTFTIYRDNTPIASGITDLFFIDTSGNNNTDYTYKVIAINDACNVPDNNNVEKIAKDEVNGSPPITSFISDSPQCLGNPIHFQDTSVNTPTSWNWDFGDGIGTSIEQNPVYTYTTSGIFTVSLSTSNSCGSGTIAQNQVKIDELPVASFTDNTPVCAGSTVYFNDTSSGLPDSWLWDFGDNSTSTEQNPTHIYTNPGNYTVKLTVSNSCGSSTPYIKNITIPSAPVADFISNSPTCLNVPMSFVDTSSGSPNSWNWDFGDGVGTSSEQNPSYLYSYSGTYNVSLTVSNSCGTSSPTIKPVIVSKTPQASFTTNSPQCLGNPINFTNTSTDAQSYNWDFGDGTGSSIEENPSYVYSAPGTYSVTLIASNQCGSSSPFIQNVSISAVPVANFTSNAPKCAGELVQFTDLSQGNPTSWIWDFGDGIGTSTEQNPSYTYLQPGNYTVSLIVSNDCGQSQVFTKIINITGSPIASFTSNAPQCQGNSISFIDTSSPAASSWLWDFGDGYTSTEQNPIHTYLASGTYTVSLTASNNCGQSLPYSQQIEVLSIPQSDFTSDAPKCKGSPVQFTDLTSGYPNSWSWNFGDGSGSSNLQNPSYTYSIAGNYSVSLNTSNICGSGNPVSKVIQILNTPSADFTSNSPQCIGTPIQFTDLSTGNPYAWQWDFGDGIGTSNLQNPSYTYNQPGNYNVSLTVSALCGTSTPKQKIVSVKPKPVSSFSSDAPKCFNEPIQFKDESTNNPIAWNWDFGDGIGTSTEKNPVYTYSNPGTYTVSLIASNECGQGTLYQKQIKVKDKPLSNFTHNAPKPAGVAVNFTDQSSGTPYQWNWEFGTGESSPDQNPSYIYTTPGTYTVKLTTANECGVSQPYSTQIQILPPVPDADFTTNEPVCLGQPMKFYDLSQNSPTSWQWNFGDGVGTSNEQNPQYTYSNAGSYLVTLISSNSYGSSQPTSKIVNVSATAPESSFTHNAPQCLGTPINFQDTSINQPLSWSWDFGDGIGSSTEQNPTYTYAEAGVFTVSLTASNGCGIGLPYSSDITINGANFITDAPKCIGDTVSFTDKSVGNVSSYYWDFGDGVGTSTQQNPTYIYNAAGEYQVSLTTTGNCSSPSTITKKIIVSSQAPIADFTSSSPNCSGLEIKLYDQSLNEPTYWEWNFGDGSPISYEKNPTHTYPISGTYTVSLKVSNGCGTSSTIFKQVIVSNSGSVQAEFSSNSPVCFNQVMQFNDLSSGSPTSWYWTFGDGSSSTQKNPSHLYTSAGNFNVSLTSSNGCSQDTIEHQVTVSVSAIQVNFSFPIRNCKGAPVQFTDLTIGGANWWRWNFGDASPYSYEQNPTHIYANAGNYNVNLLAHNACNTYGSLTKTISILSNTPVISNFTSNAPQCQNVQVKFTDTSTGNPTYWNWDFGDGIGSSTLKNPSYAYSEPGIYSVSLSAGSQNCSNNVPITKDIKILGNNLNADFAAPASICLGNSVSFTDKSSGMPEAWLWDFGDGTTSTQQNPIHTYTSTGIYNVKLIVSNRCGNPSEITKQIIVSNAIPSASFSYDQPTCTGMPVQFHDSSSNNPAAWQWNFGDGSSSYLQNPLHAYANPGNYNVSLIASNACGSSAPFSQVISIINDSSPSAISNSLKINKYNSSDLKATWQNLPPNTSGIYQIVGLEYPAIPTPENMATAPVVATSSDGTIGAIIPNALPNPVKIIYYKVRGTAVCSGSPGPL